MNSIFMRYLKFNNLPYKLKGGWVVFILFANFHHPCSFASLPKVQKEYFKKVFSGQNCKLS